MENFIISGFADEISEYVSEQFSHLNRLGISWFEPRGIDGVNISSLTDSQALVLKEKMEQHQIRVSSIGSPIGKISILDEFAPHMEQLKRTIRIAQTLGTNYIRVFSFYIPKGEEPAKYRDEVISRLRRMTQLAEEEGVVLLHENEKGIYGDKAVRCLEILEAVHSPYFRAVFDPANFIQCGQDTKEAYELLKNHVVYMHIKDALADGTVVPVGYGQGNVGWILRRLKASGYHGFLSLEPHLGSFKGLENLETDDHMLQLEGSTPEKFELAYRALCELLAKIG